ncbi:MAG: S-layer homology domain-containing protein [Firmicutes bacterium]|nr:S-layer homology domain-containing protein [Bacillota bacterium]
MKKKLLLVIALALVMVLALSAVAMADTDIDRVYISVISPSAGAKPATTFSATNLTHSVSLNSYNLLWYEKSGSGSWVIMTTSTFQTGKQYRAMFVIKPASGYFAGHPSSGSYSKYTGSYTVNGNSPSTADKNESVAYGDSGTSYARCLVAYYSFGPLGTRIGNVAVTGLDTPEAGKKLDTSVSTSGNYSLVNVYWWDVTAGGGTLPSGTTAVAGHKYNYIVRLRPNNGYYFAYSPNSNGSSAYQFFADTATINGTTCTRNKTTGPYATVDTRDGTLDINGYYTVPSGSSSNTPINDLNLKSVESVTVGERLGNTYTTSSSSFRFKRIIWRSASHQSYDSYISTETRAEAGESYQFRLYIQPESGYYFPNQVVSGKSYPVYTGTVKLNGKPADGYVDSDGYLFVESPWMTAGSAAGINNIALTVDAPVIGAKPASTFKAVNKANSIAVSPVSIIWQEKTDAGYWRYISTEIFVQGVQYQAQMVVKPASGCFAGAEGSTARVNTYTGSLTINGSKPASGTYEVFATGEDNTSYARCLVVTYDFPALGSAPVITKQPAAQSALPGGSAVFTVEASGENLKYQWYGGTDASPTPISGNDKTLTLTNLTLNNDGTDFWCVVSNETGSVTSNKAKLTVADNYVFPFTDVYANDWFYNDVKNANKLKLIDGKTPTLFKPYDNMTYAEAIKLAACMNQVYNTGTVTLKNGSPWYQTYVDYARTHGIPWNYPDYNAAITRKDYVYIFYSALPASDYKAINSIGLAKIPDVGPSTFASTEILAFYNAGILTGYTDGSFAPDKNIERSEVATILSRMMDHNVRKSFSL